MARPVFQVRPHTHGRFVDDDGDRCQITTQAEFEDACRVWDAASKGILKVDVKAQLVPKKDVDIQATALKRLSNSSCRFSHAHGPKFTVELRANEAMGNVMRHTVVCFADILMLVVALATEDPSFMYIDDEGDRCRITTEREFEEACRVWDAANAGILAIDVYGALLRSSRARVAPLAAIKTESRQPHASASDTLLTIACAQTIQQQAKLSMACQEEISTTSVVCQEEISTTSVVCQEEISTASVACQKETSSVSVACQKETSNASVACQKETSNASVACQKEMSNVSVACQKEMSNVSVACQKETSSVSVACQKEMSNVSVACQKETSNASVACQKDSSADDLMAIRARVKTASLADCEAFLKAVQKRIALLKDARIEPKSETGAGLAMAVVKMVPPTDLARTGWTAESDGATAQERTWTWSMRNNGDRPWPAGCQLQALGSLSASLLMSPHPVVGGLVAVGDMAEVQARLRLPKAAGNYSGYYRLATATHNCFGEVLLVKFKII